MFWKGQMKQTTILLVLIAMCFTTAIAEARLTRITAGPATVIDFPHSDQRELI